MEKGGVGSMAKPQKAKDIDGYISQFPAAVKAILHCRTPVLGGHVAACPGCGSEHLLYHSCRHRACPRCGHDATTRWLAQQRELLLPVGVRDGYFAAAECDPHDGVAPFAGLGQLLEGLAARLLAEGPERLAEWRHRINASLLNTGQVLLDLCPADRRGWEWHYLKRLWRVEPVVLRAPGNKEVSGVAFSPDGEHLAAACLDRTVRVWHLRTGEVVTLRGHEKYVYSVAFCPTNGRRLASFLGSAPLASSGEERDRPDEQSKVRE